MRRPGGGASLRAKTATSIVGPVSDQLQVIVAGGGIAGLEAVMALRDLAGERVAVTLVAPDPEFTYKPLTVEEPFSFTPRSDMRSSRSPRSSAPPSSRAP
jgi:heterodisulfide reductase subunit A-like polyferredoxin